EVAIRAAFKCIQHARQVAVLVPTTILVEQHLRSFRERFREYPVEIAAISRFHSNKEIGSVLAKLKSGDLDIIIGTHKLLNSRVEFKDLGLLVIDEEHRFGVKHKEILKQKRKDVDVLTLTATPIPRTLHMALIGIRDISVISTPPQDRRTIRTYVAQETEEIVSHAILREIQRGGQVFFLHNRIDSIASVTARLAKLIPESRFRFGHGQMPEAQLEEIMAEFVAHKFDTLVSTTIIESGLDIPNCNTIVITRADKLGLAQLYQLRGRVGRSSRQAHAYLLIPESRRLGLQARKRLRVLQSLDDLGLGFHLATKDLEIRGAGDLLGKDQSGSVHKIGLELYNKILKEAILQLQGDERYLHDSIEPEVKVAFDAFIPEPYIPDVSERLLLYQRLASINSQQDFMDLSDEIQDRFGHIPHEVKQLLEVMLLRSICRRYLVLKLDQSANVVTFTLSPKASIDVARFDALMEKHPGR
ncbi:MAG: DEAD/DEAH box helicase, partial [Bdellovibrionales bacterium]|nr:DEAD/DEAH box helicase [Bdellovibrionales bacterium]